jgi:phosphatidylglycerophosphate synthase
VQASPDVAGDLRAIAELASAGGAIVAQADVVTHREALAGLLADPRIGTGVLTGRVGTARALPFRVRSRRGRVVSAGSAYHAVHRPTGAFLGVLKVAGPDRETLAGVAGELAVLAAAPSAPWRAELERKAAAWRQALAQWAATGEPREPGDGDAADEPMEAEEPGGPVAHADLSPGDEALLRQRVAAATEDAASLLLVGLVRSGTHVGTSLLRKLYWARPHSPAAVARAREEIEGYDEDRVLLDSAVKGSDGFFTTFFVSPYSRYIARWAARRGFTPNQVTTVSLGIGALAAAAFATGERAGLVAGAVLLQLAFTTDCVDGQLARYTRTFSKLGAWLDSIFDRAKEYLAFAGLAIGASRTGDPVWLLACCALTLQTVRHMSDFAYGTGQHEAIGAQPHPRIEQPGDSAWAAAEKRRAALAADPDAAAAARPRRSSAERVLAAWHVLDRSRAIRWMKKMIAFPIGERFAAISLTAALWGPRTTFVVLLAWGGVAFAYSHGGRVLRSVAR